MGEVKYSTSGRVRASTRR